MHDGLNLDPFEVIFVKAKEYPRVPTTQNFLRRYTDYYMDKKKLDVEMNAYLSPEIQDMLEKEKLNLQRKINKCHAAFDVEFYLDHNADLRGTLEEESEEGGGEAAYNHFLKSGFYEKRTYRFKLLPAEEEEEEDGKDEDECRSFLTV